MQLQQNPLNLLGYIPYYLGWDASGYSGTGGICIHHPNHDVKKISTYSCTPTTVSYDSSPSVNWAVSWIATVHGYGITETASSGSPLINNDHHVIGQLRGASISLNCSNYTGTSKYGKLSDSWTGYGNNDYRRRLDYWLDPSGSNTNVINGFSLYDLCSLSNLSGPSTICSSTTNTYIINNLPSGFTINWGIDNSNFSYSPSGNQCFVTYTGTPQYSVAYLTATISWSGTTIKTLTKRIVMHGTDLYVTGFQDNVITPDYTFPYREFTIPDNGGLGLLRIRPDNFDKDSIFGPESLPIHFIENHTLEGGLRVIDLCGYGITEINGDNRVYLNSTRFDGMDISFSGPDSPIYFNHNGSNVAFTIPYHASEYYAILNAYSEAGCHDFCLTFKVVPPSFYASGDDEIWVSYIGSTLYVTFMVAGTPVGNGQYYLPSYSLTINKIPSGTQVYSQVFPGDQNTAIINTSGWSSGLYSIRIVCNNHIYTKTIGI